MDGGTMISPRAIPRQGLGRVDDANWSGSIYTSPRPGSHNELSNTSDLTFLILSCKKSKFTTTHGFTGRTGIWETLLQAAETPHWQILISSRQR